jgi:hypothetical protein
LREYNSIASLKHLHLRRNNRLHDHNPRTAGLPGKDKEPADRQRACDLQSRVCGTGDACSHETGRTGISPVATPDSARSTLQTIDLSCPFGVARLPLVLREQLQFCNTEVEHSLMDRSQLLQVIRLRSVHFASQTCDAVRLVINRLSKLCLVLSC